MLIPINSLGVDGLGAMFRDTLFKERPPTKPMPSFEANMDKNRYQDVFCIEETRVKLVKENPNETDYIHANHVRFPDHDRKYIATQAPLDNTVVDFWRMIVQESSPVIVNLTLCCEEEKNKCSQYWPMNDGEYKTFGKFTISLKKKESEDKGRLTIYVLEVLAEGCSEVYYLVE